ncbi:hypothetical protein [Sphingomonas sp. IW22]|uniref:hypothetical protein n=1 Tax=Sphingomonas sp. IW22 TaxID=3242489 RepID=UPI003521EF68
MPGLTRRQSIVALAGSGLAAGAFGFGLYGDEQGLVRAILDRVIGPFRMSDDDFTAFFDDLSADSSPVDRAKFTVYRAVSAIGTDELPGEPMRLSERVEVYERKVVTQFITRTDYARIDPRTDPVSFIGANPCSSPFAQFDIV